MSLFSTNQLKSRKIEIAQSQVCAESPEVRKRLDRISQNYEELDSILEQLEAKMQADFDCNGVFFKTCGWHGY